MELKISDAAGLTGGTVTGDNNLVINNLAKIEEAKPGDLTFLYLPHYEKYFSGTKASAIIVKTGFNKTRDDITYIEVDEPNKAFFKIVRGYFSDNSLITGIDALAFVDPSAVIGEGCSIGKNVVVSAGCKLGNNVKLFHNTVLLNGVELGNDVMIYPNVTVREQCKIGNNVIIHSGAVIGADGFGYEQNPDGTFTKIPQIGNVILEDDVEVGANVCIDRASIGSTVVKQRTKIDNLTQIAHNAVVGKDSIISSQVGISGSTKIGDNCFILGQVGITGHLDITDKVIVSPQAGVAKSITKSGTYFGSPAKDVKTAFQLEAHIRNLPSYAEQLKELKKEIELLKKELSKK